MTFSKSIRVGQNLRRQMKPSPTKGGMHVHVKLGSVPGASAHMAFGSHGSGSQGSIGSVEYVPQNDQSSIQN